MIIYKITNKKNNKVYIGQTRQTLKQRWTDHTKPSAHFCFLLKRAIEKYGKENFTIEKIDTANSIEELDSKEKNWIQHYKSYDYNFGYNRLLGGRGFNGQHSEETRKKLREASLGPKNYNFGKPKSEEWKALMREKSLGRPVSEETRKKISETLKGRPGWKPSEEHKKRLSMLQKGKPRNQRFFKKSVFCHNNQKTYESVKSAAKDINTTSSRIIAVCKGRRDNIKGYRFSYVTN